MAMSFPNLDEPRWAFYHLNHNIIFLYIMMINILYKNILWFLDELCLYSMVPWFLDEPRWAFCHLKAFAI